ncbi:hypothetical protein ACIA6D_36400 [Streptomyces cacaoi]|uniref:hypothetical protein n=1 Tax=Streptomyces cacaoi TaxID=1898 RepID=UPI003749A796
MCCIGPSSLVVQLLRGLYDLRSAIGDAVDRKRPRAAFPVPAGERLGHETDRTAEGEPVITIVN